VAPIMGELRVYDAGAGYIHELPHSPCFLSAGDEITCAGHVNAFQ
jgi:hypothetical protein